MAACAAATGEAELGRSDHAGKGDVRSTQRAVLFDEARVWSKYRKLHDKIEHAKSLRSVESLSDKAYDLTVDLGGIVGDTNNGAVAYIERVQDVHRLLLLGCEGSGGCIGGRHGGGPKLR